MSAPDFTVDAQTASEEINFYEALETLERDLPTQEIQRRLHQLKLSWGARAGKAGSTGEQARAKLELVQKAFQVFASEQAREEYDLRLGRASKASGSEEVVIDWLGRAWSYYFIEDEGAAAIAARKAKEQAPNNPQVHVVSAWVNLMRHEIRDAKRDADEAFVLDELGEDTVDVHHVRGVVFFNQKDYERAHQSFDRALAKAVPFEQVTLHMRKAWAFEQQSRFDQMFDAMQRALSIPVEVDNAQRARLHRTTFFAVDHLVEDRRGVAARVTLKQLAQRVHNSQIQAPAKAEILRFIDLAAHRADLQARAAELSEVPAPGGRPPSLPFKSLGGAVLAFLLASQWSFFWIVFLALAGFAGFMIYRRVVWGQTKTQFESAQAELSNTHDQIMRQTTAIEQAKRDKALTAR